MYFFTLYFFILIVSVLTQDSCLEDAVVSRHQWGSQVRRSRVQKVPPANRVFIHHSQGKLCSDIKNCSRLVREIEDRHIKVYRGCFLDIAYNFIIGGDGNVYEGRGWRREGAHSKGYEEDVGILFLGNFNKEKTPDVMMDTAKNLLECAVISGDLMPGYSVYGHKNVGCTDCPGQHLYSAIMKWEQFARKEALYIDCFPPYKVHSSPVKVILY